MVNKVILVGNLGKDPELRHTAGGKAVASFSLATKEKYGETEKTSWHNVVAWGKLAEVCAEHLSKGRSVYVEGSIDYREWEAKDGTKRKQTDIVARHVTFLGGAKKEGGAGEGKKTSSKKRESSDDGGLTDDDIPF